MGPRSSAHHGWVETSDKTTPSKPLTHTEFILFAIGLAWLIVKIWMWVSSRKGKKR